MFSRQSLEALSDILSDDYFGPLLHTLVLGTDHLTTDLPLEDPVPFEMQMEAPAPCEEPNIDTTKYRTYLADQNNLLSSGLAVAYLSSIFSKAKNCKTLIIDDDHRAWGANFLKRETGVYPTTTLNSLESQDFIACAFQTILIELTASGLRIETFQVYAGCVTVPINPEILSPCPVLQLSPLPFATSRTNLALAVDSGDNYSLDSETFESRVESRSFHKISQALSLPCLQTLSLSVIDCTEDDLSWIFQNHRKSLQYINLDTVNIIQKGGTWNSLLATIRSQMQLRHLSIENCFQDEEDITVHGNEMIPSSISFQFRRHLRP
ncbi:hypothetical protein ASPBRDRAFT_49543 [Aspergillus brasiliensis CBS 101740]|uniref:Uncharacterized protein n=1 Tax=Aspergillus brasiliensis (strain CBS 101740 / IMI 381727 / IBT 21946) TaxID=767769 RepID=A0A1L9U251_ASPBC|nr:hypothetical protein ASPBRDRAFT_49543 [Aspergillus brasiliensis CBS 101740]